MPRQSTSHTHIRLRSDDVQPSGTAWTLEIILDQAYSGAQGREGVCTVLFFCYRRLHNNLQACNRGTEEVHYLKYMLGQVLMLFDLHIGFGSTGAASQDGACWGMLGRKAQPVAPRTWTPRSCCELTTFAMRRSSKCRNTNSSQRMLDIAKLNPTNCAITTRHSHGRR
jgi:hypothetical protein